MRRPSAWFAASSLAALPLLGTLSGAPAAAATLLERTIAVEIHPDGKLIERTHLRARLENDADLAAWSPYPIPLDANRTLTRLTASATSPGGRETTVARRALDTVEAAPRGVLASSFKLRTVQFPALAPGALLALDYEIEELPYFPAGEVALAEDGSAVAALRVEVAGGGAGWRWRIEGGLPAGLRVEEKAGGVAVSGTISRRRPPALAPGGHIAVLRFAWGEPAASWQRVGRWYQGLLAAVARGAEPVRQMARQMTAGSDGRRARLEALLGFVRRDVRYVAVEMGIGGYRPAPPAEVLARRWGDCKDKSLLLVDLLAAAGIEAYPALALAAGDRRVDPELPVPGQFNHMIVAVPAAGLDLDASAPVAGGYLFLDATQSSGGLSWLHPEVQDQQILVIQDAQATLVRTPARPALEGRRLELDLALEPGGAAAGEVRLRLSGRSAAAFLELAERGRPQELDRALRETLAGALPGADLEKLGWSKYRSEVPQATLSARVRLSGWGGGSLPQLAGLPAPALLEGRDVPLVMAPFVNHLSLRLRLPDPRCKAETGTRAAPAPDPGRSAAAAPPQAVAIDNEVGSFHQSVEMRDGRLHLDRTSALWRRWIEPADFAQLRELVFAEYRASKRRLRIDCPTVTPTPAAPNTPGR